MKLFEMKEWQLIVSEEAWGLKPFNNILKRDKTKGKEVAHAEMLYIWFYCDIKSDFLIIPEDEREAALKEHIKALPEDWIMDDVIKSGIKLYEHMSVTTIQRLYQQSLQSARDIGDYLANTKALLAERDMQGKIVTDIAKITASVQKIPKLMSDLKAAYSEVIKEQEDSKNRKKGSRTFNLFEKGLDFDE